MGHVLLVGPEIEENPIVLPRRASDFQTQRAATGGLS